MSILKEILNEGDDIEIRKGQTFHFYIAKGEEILAETEPEIASHDISSEEMEKLNAERLKELAANARVSYAAVLRDKYDYGWVKG